MSACSSGADSLLHERLACVSNQCSLRANFHATGGGTYRIFLGMRPQPDIAPESFLLEGRFRIVDSVGRDLVTGEIRESLNATTVQSGMTTFRLSRDQANEADAIFFEFL